jgi:hypothetical protein
MFQYQQVKSNQSQNPGERVPNASDATPTTAKSRSRKKMNDFDSIAYYEELTKLKK